MPINSEWTNFSKEDRAFMDQQIQENMEIWNIEQELKKTAARRYRRDYALWKDWDEYALKNVEDVIKNGVPDILTLASQGRVYDAYYKANSVLDKLWPLCKYALEKKALTNKQKKFALDVMKRMGTGLRDAFRPRGYKTKGDMFLQWLSNWKRELSEFTKVSSMRDVEVGSANTVKVDGIIIHNSLGASEKILTTMIAQIKKATGLIKGGNYAPMKKTLYGHAHLVSNVSGGNVLGFYNSSEDNVYVRTFLRGSKGMTDDRNGYIHVLIHELGHRCFQKFIGNDFKREWNAYYNELRNKSADFKWPLEKGDIVSMRVKGITGTIHFSHKRDGWNYFYSSDNPNRNFGMGDDRRVKKILRANAKGDNFPSRYASTNYEEFYCETVAFYLRNDLKSGFIPKVKSLFGIASDEPLPEIHKGGDGEKKELSEKVDIVDKAVAWIVDFINSKVAIKRDGKYLRNVQLSLVAKELASSDFMQKELRRLVGTGIAPTTITRLLENQVNKAVEQGLADGKFEGNSDFLYIDVTELYQDEDKNDSEVEQIVGEKFGNQMMLLFEIAEDGDPVERTLLQLVRAVGDVLSKDGITVDVSVISDIIKERLDTVISLSSLSTVGKGARVELKGNKYVFSNNSINLTEKVDSGLFADYMNNNVLELLGDGDEKIFTLEELKELVDEALKWGGDKPVQNDDLKIQAINEYINSSLFTDRYALSIKGTQYIITVKSKLKGDPDTAPKDKSISFKPMNELQTNVMKEICALLKGGSGDLTASDVFKSMGDKVGDVSLRGFGRSMGKLVRLDYLCPNGKCQKGSIYKLSETGKEWCKINAPTIPAKKPASDKPQPKENSVENALLTEMRSLYQLVEPKKDKDSTDAVVAVGRELKKSKANKLNSSQVKKLSAIITKLNIDVSSLPLLKAQLIVGDSADDENVTPIVMELRKLYVDVRKAGVHKRSLTILAKIATKVKDNDLNEIVGEDLIALQRLIARAELNSADYPLIFKVIEQTDDGDKSDNTDFPSVTEVMKIALRIMGQNIDKEESASSIREKVNKFPDTNVSTKGLGRTMGALVRYGYLSKEGTSPSGTTYKGTALLARWYKANTPQGEITDLGKDIIRVIGTMTNVKGHTSKQMHTLITTAGAEVSSIGVGRSMGKLAKDGWLSKSADGLYTLTKKGQQWFYSDLALS